VIDDRELDEADRPIRRPRRGFGIVLVSLVTLSAVTLVAIFANRPLVGAIARAESELRHARSLADQRFGDAGSYAGADAATLAEADPATSYVAGDVESSDPGTVSVFASAEVWAAAVAARPHACFYLSRSADGPVRYGSGTRCTGEAAARLATDDAW
jgi:hypothetical protein